MRTSETTAATTATVGATAPAAPRGPRESLSDNEYTVLRALRDRLPLRFQLPDLAAATRIGRPACGRIVASLIGRGLAERRSPRTGATITPSGEALLAQAATR
jgi:DNA-binding MarR family transcriptional regulator